MQQNANNYRQASESTNQLLSILLTLSDLGCDVKLVLDNTTNALLTSQQFKGRMKLVGDGDQWMWNLPYGGASAVVALLVGAAAVLGEVVGAHQGDARLPVTVLHYR